MRGHGERLGAERVELGAAQPGPLYRELQRLPLDLHHRVRRVIAGLAAGRRRAPAAARRCAPAARLRLVRRPVGPGAAPRRRARPRRIPPRRTPAAALIARDAAPVLPDPGQHEALVHQAEPAVQVDGVAGPQPGVLDPGHDRGRLVQRGDLAFGRVQIVVGQRAADGELEQRYAPGDQVTDRRVPVREPKVARVQPVGLDRHERLRDEPFFQAERAQRRLLPGGVPVEGEDHLADHPVGVHDQPAQDLDVLLAERGTAGGHGGRDAGQMAGHDVGVALDDDRLPAMRDLPLGQVGSVQHGALPEQRCFRGIKVLRSVLIGVEFARAECDNVP